MNDQNDWPHIAVMGGGAVGCYYGGMLARAGARVTLIGRAQQVAAIQRDGLWFDGLHFQETIPMQASEDPAAAQDAQLVLMCVKTQDTAQAAIALKPWLAPDAVVVSLQNGVENASLIAQYTANPAIAAVVYVACAMTAPGKVRHTGRGDLVIGGIEGAAGIAAPTAAQIDQVSRTLVRAGIPCAISANVEGELWGKLLINCAYNAVSALGRSRYQRQVALPETRALMQDTVREVLAVALAEGVRMPDGDWVDIALKLADAMPQATSSTAQDIALGKQTEIDHLNGLVVRRGAARGVPTPVNRALHALVKLLEQAPAA